MQKWWRLDLWTSATDIRRKSTDPGGRPLCLRRGKSNHDATWRRESFIRALGKNGKFRRFAVSGVISFANRAIDTSCVSSTFRDTFWTRWVRCRPCAVPDSLAVKPSLEALHLPIGFATGRLPGRRVIDERMPKDAAAASRAPIPRGSGGWRRGSKVRPIRLNAWIEAGICAYRPCVLTPHRGPPLPMSKTEKQRGRAHRRCGGGKGGRVGYADTPRGLRRHSRARRRHERAGKRCARCSGKSWHERIIRVSTRYFVRRSARKIVRLVDYIWHSGSPTNQLCLPCDWNMILYECNRVNSRLAGLTRSTL